MATPLTLVGQRCMDLFYQQFKSNSDFFELSDFISYAGDTLSDYYLQEYKQLKAQMRADKQEEVVSFSENTLLQQEVKVENEDGELVGTLKSPVLTFPYDEQSSGIQFVLPVASRDCQNIERANMSFLWKKKHLPLTDRIFWYPEGPAKLKFWTNSNNNVTKVNVFYVPSVNAAMLVPDTLVDYITTNTVTKMKAIKQGTVIKKAQDLNQNVVVESEINKASVTT